MPVSLTAAQCKNHFEGVLTDAHPYRGLRLEARKTGMKTWVYRYSVKIGDKWQKKQVKLGEFPAMSLKEAREAFAKHKKTLEAGKDPQRDVRQEKTIVAEKRAMETFNVHNMIDNYLEQKVKRNRTEKSYKEAKRLLEKESAPISKRLVSELTVKYLNAFICAIADHNGRNAPNVARVFRSELKAAWSYALNAGDTNAVCFINKGTGGALKQGKRTRHLKESEIAEMALFSQEHYSKTVHHALMLTLYTGCRSGEICKLKREWIWEESDGLWITIPGEFMKKRKEHRVPLMGTSLKIVKERLQMHDSEFLFPRVNKDMTGHIDQKVLGVEIYSKSGRGNPITYANKPVCPVKNWAPNDLRKTARTELTKLGAPYDVAEKILAHSLGGVGELYNQHGYEKEKRIWLEQLGKHLDRLTLGLL